MAGLGWVEIELHEGVGQRRNELGQFTSEVERGCSAAAFNASQRGAALARAIYGGSGYGWSISFDASSSGFGASGQWAEAAEFGIPAHPISPHGNYPLVNEEEGFGPIMPPGRGVMHSGTDDLHMIEQAGEQIAAEFADILDVHLP
jgi:hypothetical protein